MHPVATGAADAATPPMGTVPRKPSSGGYIVGPSVELVSLGRLARVRVGKRTTPNSMGIWSHRAGLAPYTVCNQRNPAPAIGCKCLAGLQCDDWYEDGKR